MVISLLHADRGKGEQFERESYAKIKTFIKEWHSNLPITVTLNNVSDN